MEQKGWAQWNCCQSKLPMKNLKNNLLWQRCNGACGGRLRNVENGATLAVGC